MRDTRRVICHVVVLMFVGGLGSACTPVASDGVDQAPNRNTCEEAARHYQQCTGEYSAPPLCDGPAQAFAEMILQSDCDQIERLSEGSDKTDGIFCTWFGVNCEPEDETFRSYEYGIVFSQNLSARMHPKMTLQEINSFRDEGKEMRLAVYSAFANSLIPVLKLIGSEINPRDLDIRSEVFKAVSSFTNHLEDSINEIEINEERVFQISFVPVLTREMKPQGFIGSLSSASLYDEDKFTVYEEPYVLPEISELSDVYMRHDVYPAIGYVLRDHLISRPDQPRFLTLSITVELKPNEKASRVRAQVTVAPPVNSSIPFHEENDQIRFTHIDLPQVRVPRPNSRPDAGRYPVAFLNFDYPLSTESEPKLHVEFGPLGRVENGTWMRPEGTNFKKLVPRMVGGVPSASALEVDFYIYNLTLDVQRLEISALDMFLGFGVKYFTDWKFGRFNHTGVNEEFRTEINNAIQEQIREHEEQLSSDLSSIPLSNIHVPGEVVDTFLKAIFGNARR